MGAYKTGDARYDIVSTRVTVREFDDLNKFAAERKIGIAAAARLLMNVGLLHMDGGKQNG